MQKGVRWLYPAQDKIAVFMMACLLLALVGVDASVQKQVADSFSYFFDKHPVTTLIYGVIAIVGFFAALTLPFLRYDLRRPASVVVALNALALLIGNGYIAYNSTSSLERWISVAFAAYFAGWIVVVRYGRVEQVIARRDPRPVEALFAAALCAGVLAAARWLFKMEWFTAYSFAVAFAPTMYVAIRAQVLPTDLVQEER